MQFEGRTPTQLLWLVCCAGTWLGQAGLASAQPAPSPAPPPSIAEHTVVLTSRKTHVEIVEHMSKVIETPTELRRIDGFDPEVVDVKAISARLFRVQALAQGLTTVILTDKDNQQFSIEVFIKGDARHLQAMINSRFPDSSVEAFKVQDSVVLAGWVSQPDHITQIVEIAEQFFPAVLNQMRVGGVQQVKLKCKIMEVQRSKLRQMGFNFLAVGENGYVASTPGQLTTLSDVTLAPGGTSAEFAANTIGAASTAFGFVTDSLAVQAFFDALREEELLKILAEPTIVTTNGRPAVMLSGGEFPVPVPQSLGTTTIEWRDFGVRLEAVPVILGDGRVRMEVMPEVTERDFANSVTLGATTVPALTSRRVNTQVEMKVGQTLMLAGLLSWRQTAQTQKIPFLGELPYAGTFFRRVRYEDVETELVILLTPEFVAPVEPDQVPFGGPGRFTTQPTDRELFFYGMIEAPKYGDDCEGCHGMGCPNCQPVPAGRHFAVPIQEIQQPPLPPQPGDVRVPPLPPGKTDPSAQRTRSAMNPVTSGLRPQGPTQQVGHSQPGNVRPSATSAAAANSYQPPRSKGAVNARSKGLNSRPGLIEP